MATRAYTHVNGEPYVSPKTHVGKDPYTLAENGEEFLSLAKSFHAKVIAEYAQRKANALARGVKPEEYFDPVIEFVVDGEVVDIDSV